jgi:adenylate cyclase
MKHPTIRFERERHYPMSAAEAWRILADTDHLNRAIGLAAIEASDSSDPLLRRVRTRAYGVPVRWREFPFDWVRERRYTVRREFESGPLARVEGGIELVPDADGVTVKAFADYTPSNVTGRVLWRAGRAPVTDALEFCDRYLARRMAGHPDPVPVPAQPPEVNAARLDGLITELARAPVDGDLVRRLRARLLEGSDDQLVRIRPYALAKAWGVDRRELLRTFLYATRAGMFELRWELMCPSCRVPKAEIDSLTALPLQFHCETCGIVYDADFDKRVELRFTVHPAVREARDDVYCIGSPLRMPHVIAQHYLKAHEDRRLSLSVTAPLRLRTVGCAQELDVVAGPPSARVGEVRVTYASGRWEGPHSLTGDGALTVPDGAALVLRNQSDAPVLALLEDRAWTADATPASEVTAMQEFRDLFSSEVLAPGQQLAVRHIALVFSDLKGSTRLYEQIGDAAAYSRVSRHFDFIKQSVARAGGTVVKTMGDGVMCAFTRFDDALAAALEMQRQVGRWCESEGIDPPLVLKVGVHAGPVIAMTANGRLDYFGRTVNVAARVGAQSRGGDIVLLEEVYDRARVAPGDAAEESFATRLRGLDSERRLVRLTVDQSLRDHAAAGVALTALEGSPRTQARTRGAGDGPEP